jgi:hypothetical protein
MTVAECGIKGIPRGSNLSSIRVGAISSFSIKLPVMATEQPLRILPPAGHCYGVNPCPNHQ